MPSEKTVMLLSSNPSETELTQFKDVRANIPEKVEPGVNESSLWNSDIKDFTVISLEELRLKATLKNKVSQYSSSSPATQI